MRKKRLWSQRGMQANTSLKKKVICNLERK